MQSCRQAEMVGAPVVGVADMVAAHITQEVDTLVLVEAEEAEAVSKADMLHEEEGEGHGTYPISNPRIGQT